VRTSKKILIVQILYKKGNVSIRLTAKVRSRDVAAEKRSESNESCVRTNIHDIGVKLQNRLGRNITLRSLARNSNAKNKFRCVFRFVDEFK